MQTGTRVRSHRCWSFLASLLCLSLVASCGQRSGQTFCEAVAAGASMDELTLLLTKDGRPPTDGMASLIEDPPNSASPCAYEVRGGRVVSAKVLK
jgi:hypothetical protein